MTAFSNTPDDIYEDPRPSKGREGKGRGAEFDTGASNAHHTDLIGALERVIGTRSQPMQRRQVSAEQQRYDDYLESKAEDRKEGVDHDPDYEADRAADRMYGGY